MKKYANLIHVIILLYYVTITKADLCGEEEMSITALGKCKPISDFLNNETLTIKTEHLLYLASNNEGKIEKGNYTLEIFKLSDPKLQSHNMRKSRLYIPESCMEQLENDESIKLNRTKGIVVLVFDANEMNKNNITDNYFIIRHNSENTTKPYINSKNFDLSLCNKDPILFEDEIGIDTLTYDYNDTEPIDIDTILYGKKFGIDLFDLNSDFLNDICFKFTSEKKTDVPLDSRVEDYYQNITFCDDKESSHYLAYNYSSDKKTFTYRCAFGYYKNEADKSGYLDKIDTELKSLVSVSNIKVITCYKKFLNLRDIITNYGGMICIGVFFIQIICFLIFCFCGIKPIEEKLQDLFTLGEVILKRFKDVLKSVRVKKTDEKDDGKPKKKLNLWGTIVKMIREKKAQRNNTEEQKLKPSNPPNKRKSKITINEDDKHENKNEDDKNKKRKSKGNIKNENKDEKHEKRKSKGNIKNENKDEKHEKRKSKGDIKNENKDDKPKRRKSKMTTNKKDNEGDKQKRRKSKLSIKKPEEENENAKKENEEDKIQISDYNEEAEDNNNNNTKLVDSNENNKLNDNIKIQVKGKNDKTPEDNKEKKENINNLPTQGNKEPDQLTQDDKKSKSSQLYDYESDELNELPFKKALKYDKRSFCKYYWNILNFSHIILNVFFRHNDYNLFAVKLGLLFMTIPINLTFNIFFYTNKSIKLSYVKSMDDITSFISNIANTIYSSILSTSLLIILKTICLTHNSVRVLRKFKDLQKAKQKSMCVLRCVKIRVAIYYILSLAFLGIFGFYVLCFCAVFENTQKDLVKSTLTSWLISLIYPLIICFITSIFRVLSFKFKNRILYLIKLMMQFL